MAATDRIALGYAAPPELTAATLVPRPQAGIAAARGPRHPALSRTGASYLSGVVSATVSSSSFGTPPHIDIM